MCSINNDLIYIKQERVSDDDNDNSNHSNENLTIMTKRRGRRPKPKIICHDGVEIKPDVIRMDKDGNIIQKKPRKPRKKEEKGSRKPYRPRKPKNNNLQTTSYGDSMINVPIKQEFASDLTSSEHQSNQDIPIIETIKTESSEKRTEDIESLLFDHLFNKRIISDMNVVDEAVTFIFKKLEECMDKYSKDSEEYKTFETLNSKFSIVYNKLVSIEKSLGPLCINLLRGYSASKMSPIPIQRPWDTRTEVLNNQDQTFLDLQKAINDYCLHIKQTELLQTELTDEELLNQKASSFFLGQSTTQNNVPQYLYNSDWLIDATGSSKKEREKIIVGGGDLQSADQHTHSIYSVILSYRGDLNHGIDLPDLPIAASSVMELDKKETNVNSYRNFAITDPSEFV